MYLQVCTWMVRIESGTEPTPNKKDILVKRLTLMINVCDLDFIRLIRSILFWLIFLNIVFISKEEAKKPS